MPFGGMGCPIPQLENLAGVDFSGLQCLSAGWVVRFVGFVVRWQSCGLVSNAFRRDGLSDSDGRGDPPRPLGRVSNAFRRDGLSDHEDYRVVSMTGIVSNAFRRDGLSDFPNSPGSKGVTGVSNAFRRDGLSDVAGRIAMLLTAYGLQCLSAGWVVR